MSRFEVALMACAACAAMAGTNGGLAYGAQTSRASVSTSGVQGQFGNSNAAMMSATGRFVVFESGAYDLVAGDNGRQHIYVRDREAPLTERVSVSTSGVLGNQGSLHAAVSADGRFVVFQSQATNLVIPATTFARFHVFLRDRQAQTTTLVSATAGGSEGNQHSAAPTISADGRFVVFESLATNLTNPPGNGQRQILRFDRTTGATILVSLHDDGSQAGASCYHASVSADGNRVAFHTTASLDAQVLGGSFNIYVRDISAGDTRMASVSWGGGSAGNSHSTNPAISADGSHVAFESIAGDLINDAWNACPHIYVRDLAGGFTTRVSVSAAGAQGNLYSQNAAINADGSMVAFESQASNLIQEDSNGSADIFVYRSGTPPIVERVSVRDESVLGPGDPPDGDGWSWFPSIDDSGWEVAFESWSTDLVTGDTNGFADIFVRASDPSAVGVIPARDFSGNEIELTVQPQPIIGGESATVRYAMPREARVRIGVYDILGREIQNLEGGRTSCPSGEVRWDGRDGTGRLAAAGVYFVRLNGEFGHLARKIVLVH